MTKGKSEYFTTKTGRQIGYVYGQKPWESKPSLLILHTVVEDDKGKPFALFNEVPILGKLNKWEFAREAEKLEKRALAVERGERDAPHVQVIDFDYTRRA